MITEKAKKQLGEPKNGMETEILEYISPLITDELSDKIISGKLTLKDCLEYCFKKGKKFEVKSGKEGIAAVTPDQHFSWVREYFGIKDKTDSNKVIHFAAAKAASAPSNGLDIDFDSLF